MSGCERCGATGRDLEVSLAGGGQLLCSSCHVRVAPATVGIEPELREIARDLRVEVNALAGLAAQTGSRRLGAVVGRLRSIPLLLEVGSERESTAELFAAVESLRADAHRAVGAAK